MSYSINSTIMKAQMCAQNGAIPKINTKVDDKALRKNDKSLFSSQNDPGDKIYKSMYRDELSRASAGSFGFSQMLYDYLSKKSS